MTGEFRLDFQSLNSRGPTSNVSRCSVGSKNWGLRFQPERASVRFLTVGYRPAANIVNPNFKL